MFMSTPSAAARHCEPMVVVSLQKLRSIIRLSERNAQPLLAAYVQALPGACMPICMYLPWCSLLIKGWFFAARFVAGDLVEARYVQALLLCGAPLSRLIRVIREASAIAVQNALYHMIFTWTDCHVQCDVSSASQGPRCCHPIVYQDASTALQHQTRLSPCAGEL